MKLVETGLLTDDNGKITGEVEIYDDGTFKMIYKSSPDAKRPHTLTEEV
jgi:hypothetical protein